MRSLAHRPAPLLVGVLSKGAQGERSELGRGVGGEELRAAVNGVHRLAAGLFPGGARRTRGIRFAQRRRPSATGENASREGSVRRHPL